MNPDQLPVDLRIHIDYLAIGPEIAVIAAGLMIVLLAAVNRDRWKLDYVHLAIGLAGLAVAGFLCERQWSSIVDGKPYQALAGMVAVDGFAVFMKVVVLAATALALLLISGSKRREGVAHAEHHALVLLSASGMLMMASANDLIVVFLALEILSIALYVLAASDRRRPESQEAGLKYFVLGAFSSAFFLYGVALVYGATGTTSLPGIAQYLAANVLLSDGLLLAGIALLLVGLGFKVAAVPFHMWTPDVYQGAPTPVTGFMAAGAKAAGFAALLRVFATAFGIYRVDWQPFIWTLAVLSLLLGSVVAIVQSDIKRMLAYSSISHAGFILIGLETATDRGVAASLFYLLAYAVMVLGTFAVVTVVGRSGDDLDGYRALGRREPVLAGILTLFLFAQAGIPLTSGFVAKINMFSAAVDAEQYSLAIIAVLASVVAAFFYLRVVVLMFMSDEEGAASGRLHIDTPTVIAVGLAGAFTIVLGVLPSVFLDFARDATLLF